jgi:hypothetical protein
LSGYGTAPVDLLVRCETSKIHNIKALREMGSLMRYATLACVIVLAGPLMTRAEILSAVDSGFVTMAGGSAKGDGTLVAAATFNYSVGYEAHYSTGALGMPPGTTPLAPLDRNNYFVFDLSSLGAPITSATLLLPAGMLESVDGVEVFDVVAPIAPMAALGDAGTLMAAHGAGPMAFDSPMDPAVGVAAALYGNIEGGAGTILGSLTITPADDSTVVTIPFTATGVGYLNAFLSGPVILGGSVPSIVTASGTPQQPFGLTAPALPGMGPSVPKLMVTILPEPSTIGLGIAGLAALGFAVLRKKLRRS